MIRRYQLAFQESFIDDHLYGDIGEFFLLPTFYLPAHRLKVPLRPVHINRDAIDERKRLRVLRQHGLEHTWDNVPQIPMNFDHPEETSGPSRRPRLRQVAQVNSNFYCRNNCKAPTPKGTRAHI
jgi:hypothetical protein